MMSLGAMEATLGHNSYIDYETLELVSDLEEGGYIEPRTPAYGVAQQALHRGVETLSPKQLFIYNRVVLPAMKRIATKREVDRVLNSWPA